MFDRARLGQLGDGPLHGPVASLGGTLLASQAHGQQLPPAPIDPGGLARLRVVEGGERHADQHAERAVADMGPASHHLGDEMRAHQPAAEQIRGI
jgi:hypothetical protein